MVGRQAAALNSNSEPEFNARLEDSISFAQLGTAF
jgi:hypothetical protein